MNDMTKEERLKIHIAGLEATLSDRKKQIESLQAELKAGDQSARFQRQLKREYKRGWEDCANSMMNITHKAAIALRGVREEAFRHVLDGDKFEVGA